MITTFRERLIRAEQQFLLAFVRSDEESLKIFYEEWSKLAHDIEGVEGARRLDGSTVLLLSQVSRAIENMTGCMLKCGEILQETQTHSISDIIKDIPSGDVSTTSLHPQAIAACHPLLSNLPSSMAPSILGQEKLLDSYAYCWLMQNIHDPYPNSVQTRILSDISGTSTAQVELWFREIRDSIGWSKLSHDFYAGSVNATVAAARRVYLEHDKSVSFDIIFAFEAVKTFAEMLFFEHPAIQGKNVETGSVRAVRTIAVDQDHRIGPFPGESIIDPEGVLVAPQVDLPAPLDSFSDLSDSDEFEEEDTTPPPSIAGCKRPLAEDVLTLQMHAVARPKKRHRTSINRTYSSKPECSAPFLSAIGLSSEPTNPNSLAALISPSPPLLSLSLTPLESLPGLHPSVSQRKGSVEFDEDTSECTASYPPGHVSVHGVRKRRLSQSDSPVPTKRQCRPSTPPRRHSITNPTPPSDGFPDLSFPQNRTTDPDEVPQPTPLVSVNPDESLNLRVFDWNSIPDPLAETASSLSQPTVVYVPSSDLASQLLEPPDFGRDAKTSSFVDLDLLEDFSSSLQFPIPAGPTPDICAPFTAPPHSGSSPLPLQDFDWSSITEFIDSFMPGSTQSSSPFASSSIPPTPPGRSQESLSPSQSCDSTKQPSSVLDPSAPPSIFLPFESGAFTEEMDNLWSFLRDDL